MKSFKSKVTYDGFKKSGATSAEFHTLISELIDNCVHNEVSENSPVNVTVNIHYDDEDPHITIIDDSIGIKSEDFRSLFVNGQSSSTPGRFSVMGMGFKIASAGLGFPEYIITKLKNDPTVWRCSVAPCKNIKDEMVMEYDEYDGPYCNAILESGTIIKIKDADMVRNWTSNKYFNLFCSKLEATYPQLLGNGINLTIIYSNKKTGDSWEHVCESYEPLMSNPRNIINLESALGDNKPILDNFPITIPGYPNLEIDLTAWHKPTNIQVVEHYLKTKDETYNPEKYKTSPWGYGTRNSGLSLMYKGKILEHNLIKELSRNEKHGIILEIKDTQGLDFTALKSGIKQSPVWLDLQRIVKQKLTDIGFYVRSLTGTSSISEDEYLTKFIHLLKTDKTYQRAYNIKDPKQIVRNALTDVGFPDILIKDYEDPDKTIWVAEGKKDRGGAQEAAQLVLYMTDQKCDQGIFVSPVCNPQFDSAITAFNRDRKHSFKIQKNPLDITHLNAMAFFSI